MSKLLSKIIVWALKTIKITGEDKARVITALLANIDALPIQDAITFDQEGTILIRGKKLELEQAQLLKQSTSSLKDSYARKIIGEQMLSEANLISLKGINTEQLIFAKACIWVMMRQDELIKKLDEI